MPLLLRNVRQNRWHKDQAAQWLRVGDVPSDPLGDLNTTENRLSVWELADDRSNLERVVRAVAVGKQKLDNTGYVLFDRSLLATVGIGMVLERGGTIDEEANPWHRELVGLSGNKLVTLARLILENGESGTVLKKRLVELVRDGIEQRQLPESCRSKIPT